MGKALTAGGSTHERAAGTRERVRICTTKQGEKEGMGYEEKTCSMVLTWLPDVKPRGAVCYSPDVAFFVVPNEFSA
jgi:hypothetical protein